VGGAGQPKFLLDAQQMKVPFGAQRLNGMDGHGGQQRDVGQIDGGTHTAGSGPGSGHVDGQRRSGGGIGTGVGGGSQDF